MVRKHKEFNGDSVFSIFVYLFAAIFVVITLYPLVYILSSSFSNPESVYIGEVSLLPVNFSVESYNQIFKNQKIWIGFKNSLIYSTVGTLISTFLTFLTAYPLSREDLKGRKFFLTLYIITMFFGGGIVPLYIVIDKLNLLDSMWAVILPGCVSVYNLLVVRSYIKNSIPKELQEAAMIDGADDFRIFIKIILPLCIPMIMIMVLFYFVGYWNNYFNALMFLKTDSKFTLQLVLREILLSENGAATSSADLYRQAVLSEALKYSTIIVSTLPILLIYPFLAKYFEKGMMIGGIKE